MNPRNHFTIAISRRKSFIKTLLIALPLIVLSGCQGDATDKIRGKQLEISLSTERVKLGEPVLIGFRDAVDSVHIAGVDQEHISHKENAFEAYFENVGQKKIEVTAFEGGEQKKAVANIRVTAPAAPEQRSFEIVQQLEHNPEYYTQGLEFKEGKLYESRGQKRESAIYRLVFPSLKVEEEVRLADEEFGEGITFWGDTLYQLTWQARKVNVYDKDLNKLGNMNYPLQEGWGLCFDGEKLIASDGSHVLHFLDRNLGIMGRQEIYAGNAGLKDLNELEFVNGKVVANRYHSDQIYFIDPKTGVAEASVDFSSLRQSLTNPRAEVLNGIAYLPDRDLYLITGKLWDKAFLVRILPAAPTTETV